MAQLREGRTVRHPVGFSYWIPKGWQVKDLADTLQFVPPDPATINGGPAELYYIIGDSADGISRPDDPRIAQYLEMKLSALIPGLSRKRGPSVVPMAHGHGSGYTWGGVSGTAGEVEARAYAAILRGWGIALVGLGLPKHLNRRRPALEAIFASFSLGDGTVDRSLVGRWTYLNTNTLYNDSVWLSSYEKASMARDDSGELVLAGDGTWRRTRTSYMIAGAAGLWLEDKKRSDSKGRWSAGDGHLYLIHDDQTWESYPFRLEQVNGGEVLALRMEKKVQTWKRAR